jgi:serine/threonine protein kinase
MPDVGDVLQGKLDAYELEEVLVDGRFGKTYCAIRTSDREDVILKTIVLDSPAGWETMELFEREADRLRQLKHPSIAPYLDAVVLQQTATGAELGLVQTFITTPSIKRWVSGRGLIGVDTCLGWMEKTLEALVYLHELREPVIHGDIDWGNILLGDDGSVKLVDFATVRQELLSPATLAGGMAIGSLDFAPMEQLLGQVYPSSDLYALAMTVLAAMANTRPENFPTSGMKPNIEEILPHGTDRAIIALLAQMTEPDPHHRLDSARIALERLRALRGKNPSADASAEFSIASSSSYGNSSSLFDDSPALGDKPKQPERELTGLDRSNRDEVLRELMRSVTDLHEAIPDGEAWERLPDLERDRIHAFGIDPDGNHMVVAHKHDATVLDVSNLRVKGELNFEELARRISVSRDGKRIAILTGFEDLLFFDVGVSVWQRHHITVEGMWPGNSQMTFSANGQQIAISDDDQVNLYDWEHGKMLARWDVDGQFGLTFSPDGAYIFAVGKDKTTIIPVSGDQKQVSLPLSGIAFSPDGTRVAYTKGETVFMGAFRGLYPEISWATTDTSIQIEGGAGARLHILRFSPNQHHLFVGCAEGFWRMIDVNAGALSRFDDWRCEDRHKVKIFEVGFSPDSSRLILHGNLTPDAFHDERMGAVLGWSIPGGKFLGSLLWLDYELSVMSAQGFYGEVSELESTGFSSDNWERPEIAGPLFLGKDAEKLLSTEDRACLREFHLRREYLERAREVSGATFDLDEVTESLANLSHVALEVFWRADKRAAAGASVISRGMTDHIEDAAFDVDSDFSKEQLAELHQELLTKQSPAQDQPAKNRDINDMDYGTSQGYTDTREDYAASGRSMPPAVKSSRSERRMPPAVTHDDDEEQSPLNAPVGRERPLLEKKVGGTVYNTDAPDEQDEGGNIGEVFQALVFAAGLGFGIVYAIFYFMKGELSGAVFWGLFLGVAPALTLIFYSTLTKRIFGL